ncbi:MAG: hypothetical protein Q9165_002367 [Trypethelium subeluteriae]
MLTFDYRISGDLIRIRVGEGKGAKEFTVHEDLLRGHSPVFVAALSKGWKEVETREILFCDDNPDVFELYVCWMYAGRLWSTGEEHDEKSFGTVVREEIFLLTKAYCLGEKLLDDLFKDCVLTALLECTNSRDKKGITRRFCNKAVNYAWENTMQNAPIRRLMLDQHIWHGDSGKSYNSYSQDFLADLVPAIKMARKPPAMADPAVSSNECNYHHHAQDQPCKKRKREYTDVPRLLFKEYRED